MSNHLMNWDESKGEPFKVPENSYEFEPPAWRVLTGEHSSHIRNIHKEEGFKYYKILFPVAYYLWIICKLEEVETTRLLMGFHYGEDNDDFDNVTELEVPEEIDFNFEQPVKVYSSYPFHNMIEIKIFPFKKTLKRFDGAMVTYTGSELGYLLWHISKTYEEIYKHHWKEVGVWGHQFSDLAFGRLDLLKDNVILLSLDS